MKDKGFIVLYRDIFDWEWFDDVYVFKLFVCLIMLASHEAKRYKGKTLKRGSFITSIASLSQKVKMSETSVKNSLKKLSATGKIEQEIIPNKYRIITIKNYNKFQSVGFSKTDSKTNNKTTINNENKAEFGLPDADREWLLEGHPKPKGTAPVKTCPACFAVINMAERTCPHCGFVFEPERHKKPTKVLDIELIKYTETERVRAFKSPQECKNVNELKIYAQLHGYKPGWVYYQQKSRGWLDGQGRNRNSKRYPCRAV